MLLAACDLRLATCDVLFDQPALNLLMLIGNWLLCYQDDSDEASGIAASRPSIALASTVVRIQTALRIDPSLPLSETLAKAEELLGVSTLRSTGEGAVILRKELVAAADRILTILAHRGHQCGDLP